MVKRSEERAELGHEQTGNTAHSLAAPDRATRSRKSRADTIGIANYKLQITNYEGRAPADSLFFVIRNS